MRRFCSSKNYFVSADEFIRRYMRSKYACVIYEDKVKNQYYFFTARSCIVTNIYNDGKLNVRLAVFVAKVKWAVSLFLITDLKHV